MLLRRKATIAISAGALIVPLCGAAALAEDMQVLESNVGDYPVGRILPETPAMKLPPGGRVRVLLMTRKVTRLYEGSPGEHMGPIGGVRGTKPIQPAQKAD